MISNSDGGYQVKYVIDRLVNVGSNIETQLNRANSHLRWVGLAALIYIIGTIISIISLVALL